MNRRSACYGTVGHLYNAPVLHYPIAGMSVLRGLLGASVLSCALLAIPVARARAQRAHEVQAGQTFSSIARQHRVSVWDLALENRMEPTSQLRAGQTLSVPQRGVTYVRPGQTLSHIARAHGCSVATLQRMNALQGSGNVRAGSRIQLPGFMPAESAAIDRDWGVSERPGWVVLQGRVAGAAPQTVAVELVDAGGQVRLKGLRALGAAMRRDEQGPAQSVHPRLAVLLSKIADHFGGRAIRVVSGFREAGGYTRESSRHVQGRAADIQVAGVPHRAVFEYCRSLVQTGCGYYPQSVFVHVDVREQHAQWVDWSAPGMRARYGTLERPYRRRERKSRERPHIGRRVSRPEEVPLLVEVVNKHNHVVRVADERAPVPGAPAETQDAIDDGTEHVTEHGIEHAGEEPADELDQTGSNAI